MQSLLVCAALRTTKGLEGIYTEELMVLCMYDKKSRVKSETSLHVELRSQSWSSTAELRVLLSEYN